MDEFKARLLKARPRTVRRKLREELRGFFKKGKVAAEAEAVCPGCGAPITPRETFCGQCDGRLAGSIS